MRHYLLLFITVFCLWFLTSTPTQATIDTSQITTFRLGGSGSSNPSCYPISLNENVLATQVGQSGLGCAFQVEVRAKGEWTKVGGYFNTPPYSFNGDTFSDAGLDADFSFSCDKLSYAFDRSALPSFIQLVKEEDIPPEALFPVETEGRRYHFTVSPSAPQNQSFLLRFGYTTNCQMKRKSRETNPRIDTLTPVSNVSSSIGSCMNLSPITLNPRSGKQDLPITIVGSCSTNEPSITQSPSTTLIPQTTPSNEITPMKLACNAPCTEASQCPSECPQCGVSRQGGPICISSCGNPCTSADQCPRNCPLCSVGNDGKSTCIAQMRAACQCDGIEISSGTLTPGQQITATATVKVEDTGTKTNVSEAKALTLRFEKQQGDLWTELSNSGSLPLTLLSDRSGPRLYQTSWSVNIPKSGTGQVSYRIRADESEIECATTQQPSKTQGWFETIIIALANILGVAPPKTQLPKSNLPIPSPTQSQGNRALQFGTFSGEPTRVPTFTKNCNAVDFTITY